MALENYRIELSAPPTAADALQPRESLNAATLTTPIRWELNTPESFTFKMSTRAYKARRVDLMEEEIQIWRGRKRLVWGFPETSRNVFGMTEFTCTGLLGYYDLRRVGGNPINYLQNGSFEDGLAGWEKSPTGPAHQIVDVGGNAILGSKILRLTTAETGNPDKPKHRAVRYVKQVDGVAVGDKRGSLWTGRAYFRLRRQRVAPHKDQGLRVRLWNGANGKTVRERVFPITDNTVRDEWTEAPVALAIPYNLVDPRITVYLYAPHDGEIDWDAAGLFYRSSINRGEVDVTTALKRLAEHGQDPAFGKTPLLIGTSGALSGTETSAKFWHDERVKILDAMRSLAGGGGPDFEVDEDSRNFVVHTPERGAYKPELTLEAGRNIQGWDVYEDGSQIANSIWALGPGSGSSRPVGHAADAATLSGMRYEDVITPKGGPRRIRDLDRLARNEAVRRKRVRKFVTVTTYEGGGPSLIDNLEPGDRPRVKIKDGRVDVNEALRVYAQELDPKTDALTVRLFA